MVRKLKATALAGGTVSGETEVCTVADPWGTVMPVERFECPSCRAIYKRVRVSVSPQSVHQLIYCTVCKHPLDPTQDGEILKYFLVERPSAKRKAAFIAAERRQA